MGAAWRARDTRVDRVVAIKHLKADYLVMEYVEGEPFKGPVPVADALRLAVQIAEATAAAHGRGSCIAI
jgi:hypothetical protein